MRSGVAAFVIFGASALCASAAPDLIGLAALRSIDPTLDGSGVPVAQVEASGPGWEANPALIGGPQRLFAWISSQGTATNFPNTVGTESGHANEVAKLFFGSCGVSCGVLQVDNFEAIHFTSEIIPSEQPITAKVVNQSFAYFTRSGSVDQAYDNYAVRYNVLFISGAGNSGRPKSPGTAYNGICVGAYGGVSSVGLTSDGRCKPDLVAPGSYTSFSAPLVSGAASVLVQAASGEMDIRILKALLLNGATKPPDWTNSPSAPLHPRHGAGILNIYNSFRQLRGGQVGDPRRGWDLATASAKDYFFEVPQQSSLTATVVWLRGYGQTNISNLNAFLYNDSNGAVAASSESLVDNVEHIYLPSLSPGRYRLNVQSAAEDETFAIAYELRSSEPPRLSCQGTVATLVGEPSQAYQIQTTTDFVNWRPVLTGSTSSYGTFAFPLQGSADATFFRALALP